jgi:hypothetical protein
MHIFLLDFLKKIYHIDNLGRVSKLHIQTTPCNLTSKKELWDLLKEKNESYIWEDLEPY